MLLATLRDEDGLGGGESGVVVMGDMICGCCPCLDVTTVGVSKAVVAERNSERKGGEGDTPTRDKHGIGHIFCFVEVVDGPEIDRDRAASSIHPPDAKGPSSLLCAPGQWGPNVELLAVRLDQTVDAVPSVSDIKGSKQETSETQKGFIRPNVRSWSN